MLTGTLKSVSTFTQEREMQRKLHDGLHLGSISGRRRGPFHRQNQCAWSRAAGESDACSRDLSVLSLV